MELAVPAVLTVILMVGGAWLSATNSVDRRARLIVSASTTVPMYAVIGAWMLVDPGMHGGAYFWCGIAMIPLIILADRLFPRLRPETYRGTRTELVLSVMQGVWCGVGIGLALPA